MPNGEQATPAQERLPDPSAILSEMTLVPRRGAMMGAAAPGAAAPAGATQYRILRTLEVDEYDDPIPAAAIVPLSAPRAAPADNKFRGTARKPAKLSIA